MIFGSSGVLLVFSSHHAASVPNRCSLPSCLPGGFGPSLLGSGGPLHPSPLGSGGPLRLALWARVELNATTTSETFFVVFEPW